MTATTAAPAAVTSRPRSGGSPILASMPARARLITLIAFWGNLVCQMGIIVTGGVVRLTGSGLGCTTWPNCTPGKFTPRYTDPMGIHGFIEFGNRTLTGVLSFFSLALLVVAILWLKGKGRGFMTLAWIPFIATIAQAILGWAIISSDLHPGVVGPHMLISVAIVVISTLLVVRLYDGDGRRTAAAPRAIIALVMVLAVVSAIVLLLGTVVTGSGPHSGDAVHPARLPFDPRMVSWLHADSVMLLCGLLVGVLIAAHLVPSARTARRAAWWLTGVVALQAVIGYVQYFTALPALLVGLHMLGAALFTAAVAWLASSMWTWRADPDDAIAAPTLDATSEATR